MMLKLKKVILLAIESAGYMLAKVDPKPSGKRYFADEEISHLENDLERLPQSNLKLEGWNSREQVRSYLVDERINFYHELIVICSSQNVRFGNADVLDIGTCTGYLLRLLGQKYPTCHLYGSDTHEIFVNLASILAPTAKIAKSDILTESYPKKCGIVFCTEVLEHVLDTEHALKNILESAIAGGVVVLTVPNGRYDCTPSGQISREGNSYTGHVNYWSPESWAHHIKKHAEGRQVVTGLMNRNSNLYAIIKN